MKIKITEYEVDISEIAKIVSDEEQGATVMFVGKVRNHNFGKRVTGIFFDCYPPLAVKTMKQLALEAREKWGKDLKIAIVHSIGHRKVGEACVGIGVSSPHRDAAYEANRYLLEQLKGRVPIWKREFYDDGTDVWIGERPSATKDISSDRIETH